MGFFYLIIFNDQSKRKETNQKERTPIKKRDHQVNQYLNVKKTAYPQYGGDTKKPKLYLKVRAVTSRGDSNQCFRVAKRNQKTCGHVAVTTVFHKVKSCAREHNFPHLLN